MLRYVAILALIVAPINCVVSDGVNLYFYSPQTTAAVDLQNIALNEANVDASKQVKIICHGLAASSAVDWYSPLIETYLAKGHQVIAMDWGQYANSGYSPAIAAGDGIGELIANYIIDLRDSFGVPFSNIHIIGHSLGAHIGGFAGKHVFKKTGSKIARITGLDPAGPNFTSVSASERLDGTDALLVDVIHTNAGLLGLNKSIGTVDFYPDGGSSQNGCGILELGCSHNIVPKYFTESINSNNFVARKCDSYNNYKSGSCSQNEAAVMGEGCASTLSGGDYYLTTNSKSPYGKGE